MKPLAFTSFCDRLGVTLEPGQRVLARVAFDGVDPCDVPPDERERARAIFGDVERVPEAARSVFAAVCGARAGKSYLMGAARILHLALTVDVSRLARGEEAVAAFVGPALKAARIPFRYVEGFVDGSPAIGRMVVRRTEDAITLKREGDKRVVLWCLPATAGGGALRGRWFVGADLEEAAFFRDRDFKVNDAELFDAIEPRLLRGGQIVIPSTPWARIGLLYELWRDDYGAPKKALVAHAATELLRADPEVLAKSARTKESDLDRWRREYGAEFLDAGTSRYFDGGMVERAEGAVAAQPPAVGTLITAGGDTGFTSDSSALVVVYREGDLYHVAEELEHRPEEGRPLVPSRVVADWAATLKRHRALGVVADQFYRETVREYVLAAGLILYDAPSGNTGKAEVYARARALLHEGRVRGLSTRLGAQLREVTYRPTSGGGLSLASPRKGGHGDLASALVLALHQAWGATVKAAPPAPGSEAAMMADEEARLARMVQERREKRHEESLAYDDSFEGD